MKLHRPMLAATADEAIIQKLLSKTYLIASPKLDGIRGTVQHAKLLSRSLKLIRNEYVQQMLGCERLQGIDGELIVGSPTAKDVYRKTNSAIMSIKGKPDFVFYIFDYLIDGGYCKRLSKLLAKFGNSGRIQVHSYRAINSFAELIDYEETVLKRGYEGLIVRHPDALYKHNRSTKSEGGMLKLKRYEDDEAIILKVVELQHNDNPAMQNELGLASRSSHSYNKVSGGAMGSLLVLNKLTGQRFNIGTGFTAIERAWFWDNQSNLIHKVVKYKFFNQGIKDLPRHPVYLGMRDAIDL